MTKREFEELKKGTFLKLKKENRVVEIGGKGYEYINVIRGTRNDGILMGNILYDYKDFVVITKQEFYQIKIDYLKNHIKECEAKIKDFEAKRDEV